MVGIMLMVDVASPNQTQISRPWGPSCSLSGDRDAQGIGEGLRVVRPPPALILYGTRTSSSTRFEQEERGDRKLERACAGVVHHAPTLG